MSAHTSQTELKLIGKLILEGEMHCQTGLHVGAGKGSLEIGGSDVMTMDEILRVMMEVRGKRKPLIHFPVWMPKLAAFFLQVLPKPPLSPDAVDFAVGDVLADTGPLLEAFDVNLTPLREGLATYLVR